MAINFVRLGPGDYDRAKSVLNKAKHPGFVGRELFYRCATNGTACIAIIDNVDVGVALIATHKLQALSVVVSAQKMGVGSALMRETCPKFVNAIMDKVSWFERLGYRPLGPPHVGKQGRMAVQLMELFNAVDIPPARARSNAEHALLTPDNDKSNESKFSLDLVCGAHREQLAFCRDRSPWIHAMCARQSGKSQGDNFILFDNALNTPGSTNIFLGLKGTGVKFSMWEPVWKPLCARFGITDSAHNNTFMLTTFDNGSRVAFAGTDDLSNARKYLGNAFPGGVFIIDEAQSQTDSMLRYLIENLLPPTLTDTSRVYMTGVLPDVPAGYFYERATAESLATAPGLRQSKGWSHHEWGRASNVHTPNAMAWLAEHKRQFNIPDNDPQVLRDWYMQRVWDPNATAYRYDRSRNAYTPNHPEWLYEAQSWLAQPGNPGGTLMAAIPWRGIEIISVALDPGGHDRTAIEVTGWGSTLPEVQHLFDWSTERHATAGWDSMGRVLELVRKHYMPGRASYWWYDTNSDNELDTFVQTYGVPALKPADKKDMPGQVRMVNMLLGSGTFKVMEGSKLEDDYIKARWDETAARDRRFEWSSQWHPDPSEAARYSLKPYFNIYVPPDTRTAYEKMRDEERERIEKILDESRGGLDIQDQLGRILGINEPGG